jgi:hypothetical protein
VHVVHSEKAQRFRPGTTDKSAAVRAFAAGVLVEGMTTTGGQLSGRDRARVAVAAFCSDRTVKRYLDGETVSDSTRLRIVGALRKLGLGGAR